MACRTFGRLFTIVYLLAVAGYVVGSIGWLDAMIGRPSAIVLTILGLPWVLFPLDALLDQAYWPVTGVLAPVINLVLLRFICRRLAA